MSLIDSWTGYQTAEEADSRLISSKGGAWKNPGSCEISPLAQNEIVHAVWVGQNFTVYTDHPVTSPIGELFLCSVHAGTKFLIGPSADESAAPSTEVTIAAIHDLSGLTWEQIARALAVSKRTVLLWARGKRLSNKNHELVLSLKQLVDSVSGDPDTRRNALLASTPTRVSALTRWVQENVGDQDRINAPTEAAHVLMG